MIVRCIKLLPNDMEAIKLGENFLPGKQVFHLQIGLEYLVYSMSIFEGMPWIDIMSESGLYLKPAPLCLFKIVNPKISKYWEIRLKGENLLFAPSPFFADNFYDDLMEGVENVVMEFNGVHMLLKKEHKN